jgi:hypothetical protein
MAAVPAGLLTIPLLKILTNSKTHSVDLSQLQFSYWCCSRSLVRSWLLVYTINISLTLGLF